MKYNKTIIYNINRNKKNIFITSYKTIQNFKSLFYIFQNRKYNSQ